jgi:methionyl-tRNA synthetase
MPRRILVTSALPYANGPTHLGHVTETVQTDIWVRFQRLRGHDCLYVCADDTHGTPIMLRAQSEGVTPEQLIEQVGVERRRTFAGFLISFDNYYTTHSEENRHYTERVFGALDAAGHIARRTVRQAYDEQAQMFLPDRYVKGTCPRCGATEQYGDSCEACGATYSPSDLKDAVSVISGTPPVERESEHLFFRLGDFEPMLREWTRSGALQAAVANKLDEWFEAGLRDWDVSRDAPYFGFEIPGAPGKYFYVWLDAPIGYMASFSRLCEREGLDFDAYWLPGGGTELYHFIGKDILYFHALFWPATLHGAGFRRPDGVFVHGFLTINGQKMSKSRGTFITAERYLERLPAEYFRYFLAAKLSAGVEDIDMNLEEFTSRINAEVVGKLVNIASRCAGFITRGHAGRLATALPDAGLYQSFAAAGETIAKLYEDREYAAAIREIMALADRANVYIDQHKPWLAARDPARAAEVQAVCTQGLNLFRALMIYLKPVLPAMAERAEAFLQSPVGHWNDVSQPLLGSAIQPYEPLATRLDPKQVETLVESPAAVPAVAAPDTPNAPVATAAATSAGLPEITVEDFAKLELRVARVAAAATVEGADKLLRLTLDLGGGDERTVFAGISLAYEPGQLVGRHVVVVANLKPRKMRFGLSQGMVLAAGAGGADIFLVSPDPGAEPGMPVK